MASSDAGYPAVSGTVRDAIVESVTAELHGHGMGISDFLSRPFKGMALKYVTHRLTSDRGELTDRITDPGGDIMRFLARGDNAREFLKQAIADSEGPVVLFGHSLGGIMCADLLVTEHLPQVSVS